MQEFYLVNGFLKVNHKCRGYCTIPYPNHPKGCPNFGKHDECPPKAPLVEDVFDFDEKMFFIIEEFNLKAHVEKMKTKHPHWTPRQCKNLLYWQGGVRKRLREKTQNFITWNDPCMIYTLLPEAMGVMVIDTALAVGIPIEKTPENKVFKISLVGYPYKKPFKSDLTTTECGRCENTTRINSSPTPLSESILE